MFTDRHYRVHTRYQLKKSPYRMFVRVKSLCILWWHCVFEVVFGCLDSLKLQSKILIVRTYFCDNIILLWRHIWSYLKSNLNLSNSARYFGRKSTTSSVALGYNYTTSFPAHLFVINWKRKTGSGTLQTED